MFGNILIRKIIVQFWDRFLQVTHQKFVPTSNIDGRTIEFLLDRYDAANVILI